jgi:hypothetical protein
MNPGSKVGRLVLISAIVLFAVSFFLPALGACEACSAPRGYYCAYFTFCYPWAGEGRRLFSSEPLEWFGFLFSGWINAAFLSALFFLQRNQTARFRVVRKILLLIASGLLDRLLQNTFESLNRLFSLDSGDVNCSLC